eukprot:8692848-Ditylum_brightwellii.AAC.1
MAHKVVGEGHMKIPNGDSSYSRVHAWYTPTMQTTVLSSGEVIKRHQKLYKANTIYCDAEEKLGYVKYHGRVSSFDVGLYTKYHNKKAFTLPLVPISFNDGTDQNNDEVNYMTEDGLRRIWHQQLCHTHNVSNLHHFVDGVPKIKNPSDIDKCDTYLICKMQKAAKGNEDIRKDAE